MKIWQKRIAGALAGVAVVLMGAWVAGFEWERGPDAVMLYTITLFVSAWLAAFPFRDD